MNWRHIWRRLRSTMGERIIAGIIITLLAIYFLGLLAD